MNMASLSIMVWWYSSKLKNFTDRMSRIIENQGIYLLGNSNWPTVTKVLGQWICYDLTQLCGKLLAIYFTDGRLLFNGNLKIIASVAGVYSSHSTCAFSPLHTCRS